MGSIRSRRVAVLVGSEVEVVELKLGGVVVFGFEDEDFLVREDVSIGGS